MVIKHLAWIVVVIVLLSSCASRSVEKSEYVGELNLVFESHSTALADWNAFITKFEDANWDLMELDAILDTFEEMDTHSSQLSSVAASNSQILSSLEVPTDCREGHLLLLDSFQKTIRAADLWGIWVTKIVIQFESALESGDIDLDSFFDTSQIEEGDKLMAESNLLSQRANFALKDCTE